MTVVSRREIQNNLTILKGYSNLEYNEMVRKNREEFERACRNQGQYLPSEDEMARWFKEKKV